MIIGITGLIGTGKSTVASIAHDLGAAVHDADKCVHDLYKDPRVIDEIREKFDITSEHCDRNALMDSLRDNPARKELLESIIHPKVRVSQLAFLDGHKDKQWRVLDIPLLFETQADKLCDEVWVTTCTPATQKARVLARDGFDEEKFQTILKWQGDDIHKKERATHIIDTDKPMNELVIHIQSLLGYQS